jgi:cation diffusion facilitator family transporter
VNSPGKDRAAREWMIKNKRFEEGERAARLSAFTLLVLGVLRGVVAVFSGSLALLAGAIDTFSDVFSSVAVWAGLRIAEKKPTERFPYGYYKAETFALLIVSLVIIVSSILIMLQSWEKLFEVNVISFSNYALAVAAFSTFVYYLLAKYKERVGRQIGSQALMSESLHSMMDVYSSILVFAGVFLGVFGYQVFEALVGLIISVYVLVRGLLFGKDAVLILMDVSPSPQMVREMKELTESVNGVNGTHAVRLRKSGPVFFGEMHVELREGLSLKKAHAISDLIEAKIFERFKNLASLTVHVGLEHKKRTRIAVPIQEDKGSDSKSSPHFGSAPYFAIIEVEDKQILSFNIKENRGAISSHKKGIQAANLLVEEKVDVLLAAALGEGPFHVLGDNLIQIYRLPESKGIQEAVHLLTQNSLEKMESPREPLRK